MPQRKRQRYKGYDYSNFGLYFITICTYNVKKIFGTVYKLSEFGQIAESELTNLPERYDNKIDITIYSIMPNHIHFIIAINNENKDPALNVSRIVGNYKAGVTRQIHEIDPDITVWQKSFYDHIIISEREFNNMTDYIYNNKMAHLVNTGVIDDTLESFYKFTDENIPR